jgi:hypothetical protein
MGENIIAFPDGIVQVRSTAPPNVPAKNHIGPCWFVPQFSPVGSPAGLLSLGIERSYCHQIADHSEYDLPYGFESTGKTSVLGEILLWACTGGLEIVLKIKNTPVMLTITAVFKVNFTIGNLIFLL